MATQNNEVDNQTVDSQEDSIKYEQRSLLQSFLRSFLKNKLSLIGATIIGTMFLLALFAPYIAPHDPLATFDAPPGEYHPSPPGTELPQVDDDGNVHETSTAWLGTDQHGRDILSRMLYGVRVLLTVSMLGIATSMVIGASLGALAGYYSDTWTDETIMRSMDVVFSFPSLVLAVGLLGMFGMGHSTVYGVPYPPIAKIITVIGIAYMPYFARVMRGAVMKEAEEEYVEAAKAIGASDLNILGKDIMINAIPIIIVQGTMYMGTAVLISAGLSFLGLGIQPPTPSLGLMLANSRDYLHSGEWWFSIFPGGMIIFAIMGFNLMGDGLRDALDPRHSTEEIE